MFLLTIKGVGFCFLVINGNKLALKPEIGAIIFLRLTIYAFSLNYFLPKPILFRIHEQHGGGLALFEEIGLSFGFLLIIKGQTFTDMSLKAVNSL